MGSDHTLGERHSLCLGIGVYGAVPEEGGGIYCGSKVLDGATGEVCASTRTRGDRAAIIEGVACDCLSGLEATSRSTNDEVVQEGQGCEACVGKVDDVASRVCCSR